MSAKKWVPIMGVSRPGVGGGPLRPKRKSARNVEAQLRPPSKLPLAHHEALALLIA